MGEEVKKTEEKKPAPEAAATEKKDKEEKAQVSSDAEKPDKKVNDDANTNPSKQDTSPPPPPEIVMRVYMHCEGCARKVRRCIKSIDGVEDVITDCKTHKVIVKGEKADPLKVVDKVQRKTHRQVELLSPLPKPSPPEEKKVEEKEAPKPEEKKEEPKVVTVVLKVHMHCGACSLEIKKRIERMKEVEEAIPDLKSSQVTVKGTFDPPKLVEYVYKRTGKHAMILKQDPPPEQKAKEGKDGKEEKKGEGGEEGKKGDEKGEEGKRDKKEDGGAGVEGDGKATVVDGGGESGSGEEVPKVELRRNEYYYYPPRYAVEMHAYPPQMFSDENPNACSIM